MQETEMAKMATRFVNGTSQNIFLTGKAGTGKTTFLGEISRSTHKRHVIVAPTGIAALNAKGVTIHSQFLLPLGSFLPTTNDMDISSTFYNSNTLVRRHPINAKRKDVLRQIDLLIIDEVSMLRADLLDAIDARLRFVKRNSRPFGGVQLLLIGDMYQLPPVVKDREWETLKQHYDSPHFFSSNALKKAGCVQVELDKIFRQQDDDFISILNNLRNNTVGQEDVEALNARFRKADEIPKDVITVTTHNYKADEINKRELEQLKGKTYSYYAQVEGDFPEHNYPVPECIELKENARIMFVKNDTIHGDYFNGKLATVISLDEEEIVVRMDGSNADYTIRHEQWENKRYRTNEETKDLEEEYLGSYSQYPIKLAWAITVHKSQGLTFEKAVIDVGQAFAPGQVYVALSRLTALDGLVLRTRIDPSVVSTDPEVVKHARTGSKKDELVKKLESGQAAFIEEFLKSTFDFEALSRAVYGVNSKFNSKQDFEDEEMREALKSLVARIKTEEENCRKFQQQLSGLLAHRQAEQLTERVQKGAEYYIAFVKALMADLMLHIEHIGQFTRTKTYLTALAELDILLLNKWESCDKAQTLVRQILKDEPIDIPKALKEKRIAEREKIKQEAQRLAEEQPKNTSRKTGRTRKKSGGGKKEKGSTYKETFALLAKGKDAEEIAAERGLQRSTIEGHFAKGIADGQIQLKDVMDADTVASIEALFAEDPEEDLGALMGKSDGEFTYGQLRMVRAALETKKELAE